MDKLPSTQLAPNNATAQQESPLPSIISERCVHAIIETASCRRCVDACPTGAWLLDDDALNLDTAACDGCGLCIPACTEGAIYHRHEILVGEWQGITVAVCGCEKGGAVKHNVAEDAGIIPCIHAIGICDILRLQQQGVTQLLVSRGDCKQCPRGGGIQLSQSVDTINSAQQPAGHIALGLDYQPPDLWGQIRRKIIAQAARRPLSRRGFLSGLVNANLQSGIVRFTLSSGDEKPFVAPGKLFSQVTTATIWPYVPSIDARLCNGCDACSRGCPHAAIVLEEINETFRYRVNAASCSGCHICVDLCEVDAVKVAQWQRQIEGEVVLRRNRCRVCGNAFHRPHDPSQEPPQEHDSVCRICAKHNHYKNLFQVFGETETLA
ncbi:MAG: 4Fe-4S binding protein [Gammaproteobacteria bacterium]|nr:4Fe-4S binding protein [Gammaproteobacteria bacterium]